MHSRQRAARTPARTKVARFLLFALFGAATAIGSGPAPAQNVQDAIRFLDTLLQSSPPPPRRAEPRSDEHQVTPRVERGTAVRGSAAQRSRIASAQQMLNALGYDAGEVDGVAGQRTLAAAAAFRAAYGLDPRGGIDDALVAALSVASRGTPGSVEQPAPRRAGVGPSFSCGDATKATERAICADPQLAAMDDEIARLYGSLREAARGGARERLRADQSRWIAVRNACRTNAACIGERMRERAVALASQTEGRPLAARPVADAVTTPSPIAPARAIAFDRPGIRAVEPVMVEGRLLTGFPVIFGDLKGAPIDMRHRQVASTEVALALYFDLAVFKQWPQVFDEARPAYFFAERFLTGELADQYLVGCPAGCGADLPYPGWTGDNEFEREATYRRFRETIVPELMAKAPSFPIGIKHVIEVELGAYDRTRQVFPLRLMRPGSNWDPHFGTMGPARRIHVAEDYRFPKELPVAAGKAQALLGRLAGKRNVYLALDQRLDQPEWNADRDAPKLTMIVDRARLYADAGLGHPLHEFVEEGRSVVDAPQADETIAGPMTLDYWRDSVLIGGRAVTAIGGLSDRMEDAPEGWDPRTNIVALVRDYALVDDPTWLEHDGSGLELIFQLDAPLRAEIIEEAIGRPLAEHEKISLQHSGGYPIHPVAGDPFAERRAIVALRRRAEQVVPKDLPPQPIPLRVYCFADIGRYEFASQSFPISTHTCDGGIDGIDWSGGASGAPRAEGEVPASLPLPPEEAEAFSATIEGNRRVTVSFETDLTIAASKSEAGFRRVATLSPRSAFWIHAPRRMTETLYRLDKPSPPADASGDPAQPGVTIAGDPDRMWDLRHADQRAALLEFAQPMGSLPYDGRALLSGAEGNYGIAVGSSGPFNPSPEDPGTSGPFFGSPRIDYAPTLANALAVPREHLLNMAYVDDEREPISGIVALLPAPYESFVRTAPAGSYGQTQMVFETSLEIAGVHRFEIAFARPLIVLSVRPKSARFMTNDSDGRRPLETFDLTTPISFGDYEVLAVPSRVAQVVAAAEALGSDVGEVVGNTMRWPDGGGLDVFQRQDFVARLVEAGRASKPDDTLWVTGALNIGEYDFATQSFPPNSVSLELIEVLRSLDLPLSSVGLQMADASPFAVRMPPDEARTFAQAYPPHSIVPLRARIRTSSPTLQHRSIGFSIEVLEAELLANNSVPTVRDSQRIVYRYPMSAPAASPPSEDEMAGTAEMDEPEPDHEPVARDILGVQLFQPVDSALARIAADLATPETYFATREARAAQGGHSPWESYSTATLLHAPAEQLMVAVYSEPPAGENVVSGVTRSQTFKPGEGPHPDILVARVKEKYGEPWDATKPAEGIYYWRSGQEAGGKTPQRSDPNAPNCWVPGAAAGYAVELHTARMMREAGQKNTNEPAWNDASGQRWEPTFTQPFDLRAVFTGLADCDEEILIVIIHTGSDGLATGFHMALTNPAAAARYRADNESRFVSTSGDGSGGGAKIKF